MQTTATYDPSSEEFVVHTPTTLAQKYWITNASVHAQWAVVFAHLWVAGTNHGIHGFLVRIRGDDMAPCAGVVIEDMGHKMGCNGVDNGESGVEFGVEFEWGWVGLRVCVSRMGARRVLWGRVLLWWGFGVVGEERRMRSLTHKNNTTTITTTPTKHKTTHNKHKTINKINKTTRQASSASSTSASPAPPSSTPSPPSPPTAASPRGSPSPATASSRSPTSCCRGASASPR